MTKKCVMVPCKVDGGWSAWSDFGACSVSCGAEVKCSTRICNNPRAEHGGENARETVRKKQNVICHLVKVRNHSKGTSCPLVFLPCITIIIYL